MSSAGLENEPLVMPALERLEVRAPTFDLLGQLTAPKLSLLRVISREQGLSGDEIDLWAPRFPLLNSLSLEPAAIRDTLRAIVESPWAARLQELELGYQINLPTLEWLVRSRGKLPSMKRLVLKGGMVNGAKVDRSLIQRFPALRIRSSA